MNKQCSSIAHYADGQITLFIEMSQFNILKLKEKHHKLLSTEINVITIHDSTIQQRSSPKYITKINKIE